MEELRISLNRIVTKLDEISFALRIILMHEVVIEHGKPHTFNETITSYALLLRKALQNTVNNLNRCRNVYIGL